MRLTLFIFFIIISQIGFTQDFKTSDIPIFIVDTDNQQINDSSKIKARLKVLNGSGVNNIHDLGYEYHGFISIKLRGNTSLSFDKKQYSFETQTIDGENNNVSLLGFPKENDWVLQGPYSDKSLIRNALAYNMSADLGHYSPRITFCEFVLNNDYRGVFLLIEKIKRDKNRVAVTEFESNWHLGHELAGGYIMRIDRPKDCYGVWSNQSVYSQFVYPKCEDASWEQREYIKNYINLFEDELYNGGDYGKYLDIHSAVDLFIVNELSKNIDAYDLSTYFYKDKGGKLTFGPVWDYNIAFGNSFYSGGEHTKEYVATGNQKWWGVLVQDSLFQQKLTERWCNLRKESLREDKLMFLIDSLSSFSADAVKRNFEKWDIMGGKVWPNYYLTHTYEEEIDYLKKWLRLRLIWMDKKILNNCTYCIDSEYCQNKKDGMRIDVFPNPLIDNMFFEFTLEDEQRISIRLRDVITGDVNVLLLDKQLFLKGYHEFIYNFETSSTLVNGVYLLEIFNETEILYQKKIVKSTY